MPQDGTFRWHTNPSTRPLVMSKRYRVLSEEPAHTFTKTGTVPALNESVDVPWSPSQSADLVNVDLDWDLPDDLDLDLYRLENGKETQVTTSGNIPGEKESVTLVDVQAGTNHVFRVINFASVPGQEFRLDFARFDAETVDTDRRPAQARHGRPRRVRSEGPAAEAGAPKAEQR